jgi:hypothetical protein
MITFNFKTLSFLVIMPLIQIKLMNLKEKILRWSFFIIYNKNILKILHLQIEKQYISLFFFFDFIFYINNKNNFFFKFM